MAQPCLCEEEEFHSSFLKQHNIQHKHLKHTNKASLFLEKDKKSTARQKAVVSRQTAQVLAKL